MAFQQRMEKPFPQLRVEARKISGPQDKFENV
jgi:hypothetical protein